MHEHRWKKHGDPLIGAAVPRVEVCSIEGCGRQHLALGWCSMHYGRWADTGDVALAPSPRLRMAATKCNICKHGDVEAIEAAVSEGASLNSVALMFNTPRDGISRHMRLHVDNLEMATAVASAAAIRLAAAHRRAAGVDT